MSVQPDIDGLVFTDLAAEWAIPCDFAESWGDLHHGEAAWIAYRVTCSCGKAGGARLICTDCKDLLMHSEDAIRCIACPVIYQPARTLVSRIEPL